MEDEISYGTTTNYDLPYPNDGEDNADVIAVVQALAEAVDTTIFNIVGDIATAIDTLNGEVV